MHADNVYEDIQDVNGLKRHMMETLEDYNNTPGVVQQDLVLFRDAIEHGECRDLHIILRNLTNPQFLPYQLNVVVLNHSFCLLSCQGSFQSSAVYI